MHLRGPGVTCILNTYRREEVLTSQLRALAEQTVSIDQVLVWRNEPLTDRVEVPNLPVTFVDSSTNLGVWARFALALNVDSPYTCVFDDDTIPGSRWLENCLDTIQSSNGLLGTRGLRFRTRTSYHLADEIGWRAPNWRTERVDIVGHAWFFRTEWIRTFWSVSPPMPRQKLMGEDIHFSYALQKELEIHTFVPPHPPNDVELWGSRPELGMELGTNDSAISGQVGALPKFQEVYRAYIDNGFDLCGKATVSDKTLAVAVNLASSDIYRHLEERSRWARRLRELGRRVRTHLRSANQD